MRKTTLICLAAALAAAAALADLTLGQTPTNMVNASMADVKESIDYLSSLLQPQGQTMTETNTVATLRYHYGMETVSIGSGATLTADLEDWPNGACVFTVLDPAGSYSVNTNLIEFVGYGLWPTNAAQCITWRKGAKAYLSVLKED